ncbi:insulinase family protein [Candidatus Woesearchaeota archaeon]|nr:insulinase family protein [Candidatus Woesearchaeota archaeon]
MKKYTLKNGLKLIVDARDTETFSIMAEVLIGSLYEKGNEGISHLVEHMVFEGTKKRRDAKEISREIEGIGGLINAFTEHERTCFFVKVPKKNAALAIDVISDIIQNSVFSSKAFRKEKGVILNEINMSLDEPRFHQWNIFYDAVFPNHPAGKPIYGAVESLKGLSRDSAFEFYKKNYVPGNIVIGVVGNLKNAKETVEKKFSFLPKQFSLPKIPKFPASGPKTVAEKRKTKHSYFVLGYRTVPRHHPDSYAIDVIKAILGRGQSGILFDEIRNKLGLVYEVGVLHDVKKSFGVFAVYLNTDKKNLPLCREIALREIRNLAGVPESEVKEAIGFIEGSTILDHEITENRAEDICFWEAIGNSGLMDSYLKRIRNVTRADVARAAKKYFSGKPVIAVIEQG